MRIAKLLLFSSVAFLVSACGGGNQNKEPEEVVMSPYDTEISGDMGECFKVVERSYETTGNFPKIVTIEVERTDEDLPFFEDQIFSYSVISSNADFTSVGFGIEFLDDEGNILSELSASEGGMAGSYDPDEAVELVKLQTGEKGTIRFAVRGDALKATKFRLTSAYDNKRGTHVAAPSLSSSDNYDESDTGSSNWDALLDSYDRYVTKYIALAKKVKEGDMSAMSEYASMMQEAQNLSTKLSDAQNDMSSSQLARYVQITNKLSNAVQDM